MTYTIEVSGESCTLDLYQNASHAGWDYTFQGARTASGSASVVEIAPGVFSVLLKNRSLTVHVNRTADGLEVWCDSEQFFASISDPRDRPRRGSKPQTEGAVEVRAHMPGKIIKFLVKVGDRVEAGQGLIVVEAMKMQNELKAPKGGLVSALNVEEGATVSAGDSLVVIE